MVDSVIRHFCAQQREWLAAELESEKAEAPALATGSSKEDSGRSNVLVGLEVEEISVGLYGRTVVVLARRNQNETNGEKNDTKGSPILLPAHRFTTGDEVEIRRTKGDSGKKGQHHSGVVCQVTDASISVALFAKQHHKRNNDTGKGEDESEDILDSGVPLSLVPSASIEVHKKYLHALSDLEKFGSSHPVAGKVVQALFDPSLERNNDGNKPSTASDKLSFVPFNSSLDESQLRAIQFALFEGRTISCIHGGPGSGKTSTLVELLNQSVHTQQLKVLVCATSNVAVDNLLSRLVANDPSRSQTSNKKKSPKLRVVRIGHPARLQPAILPYSLEALVQSADGTEIVKDVRKELQSFLNVLSNPKSRGNDKRVAYREMKNLRQEVRQREEKVVSELLASAQVVCCTCVGADNNLLNKLADNPFDLCVIDEAAQALESACWIPTLRAKRLILAGDHKQLPPTIQSNQPVVAKGLSRTMFERLMQIYGDDSPDIVDGKVSRMLQVQYRMNQKICDWASQALYGGRLRTHKTVATRTLAELNAEPSSVNVDELDGFGPLLLIDTAGCAMYESVNAAGSRYNEMEVDLVAQHVGRLVSFGVPAQEIAVITPYNGQVEMLRSRLLGDYPKLEVRSVDGFQGGEREAVVLSMVRSSDRGGEDGIGFLRDDRRLNVAVTRAKRHCCVVADSETVSQSVFIKGLIDWIEANGESRSAIEFVSNTSINDDQIQSDLLAAEQEMNRLQLATDTQKMKASKQLSKNSTQEKEIHLIRQVEDFAKNAVHGAEMTFHSELNANQRRIVHEAAEKLMLEHKSEGTEGVDRRITLKVPALVKADKAIDKEDREQPSDSRLLDQTSDSQRGDVHVGQQFAAFSEDTDEGSSGGNNDGSEAKEQASESKSSNGLLAELAKERANRESQNAGIPHAAGRQAHKQKKKAKKKGQKLGGKAKHINQNDEIPGSDEMDDMAFLDAQIEKNQNSHGRTIQGKGQSYRTVMNGILISKPKPQEKQRNAKATAVLQSKLKQKQDGRKAQTKKNKK